VTGPAPHETTSPEQTEALGAELAASLRAGDVVLLYGEMGAGKTTFVRGALRALGNAGPVTSPTYTIARHYEDGPVPVAHLDLHRLAGLEDEDPAFLEDHLDPGRIAFVEWPQIADEAPELTARVAARVHLEHVAPDRRRVEVTR
jgi:tRNA threonylcarbamoyladenosine biosynthesis protein TsaE